METIDSGVIMRHSSGSQAGTIAYPGRDLRNVHPARRIETIAYSIQSDQEGLHTHDHRTGKRLDWEHYKYVFTYRHQGNTLRVTWRCGSKYGDPKPIDGLVSAMLDAEAIAWEAFGEDWAADLGYEDMREAERVYKACEDMEHRLAAFLGSEREAWELATAEDR